MIHAIGDSHSTRTFVGIPGVVVHHLGPVTMNRIGRPEEPLLGNAVAAIKLAPTDVLVFCFGEIDARVHIKIQTEYRKLEEVVGDLVARYLDRVALLNSQGARRVVLSVTPPTTTQRAYNFDVPVEGTDGERVHYTRRLNQLLAEGCHKRGLTFLDVYPEYADPNGMLLVPLADECVHIKDTSRVRKVMQGMGLL